MKIKSVLFFVLMSQFIVVFGQTKAYLKDEADNYFKLGQYWDAFFLYHDISKLPDYQENSEILDQIKNSSRAMFLWKKTEDYRAFRKYETAKQNLAQLLVINPYDPNKGLYPRLSLEQASEYQRLAYNQSNPASRADYLNKALQMYSMALNEGLRDEMVFSLIKQCEASLEKTNSLKVVQPTSYGLKYEKEKEYQAQMERNRTVEIIKEKL